MWAVARLQRTCAAVAVNARPGTEAEALARAAGLAVLHDAPGDAAGPLAGVKAGLRLGPGGSEPVRVRGQPVRRAVAPEELFTRLIDAGGDGAAMAETTDGRQPLCALWPTSALAKVTAALADGAHPATWSVLDSLGAVHVHFAGRREVREPQHPRGPGGARRATRKPSVVLRRTTSDTGWR